MTSPGPHRCEPSGAGTSEADRPQAGGPGVDGSRPVGAGGDDGAGAVATGAVDDVFGPAPDGEDPLFAELAHVALEAATGAAAIAARAIAGDAIAPGSTGAAIGRSTSLQVETKSSATDLVSEVDRRCEAHIAEVLARRRPTDGLLGEEGGARDGESGVRWVVDPIDGTTNYVFGVPVWAVSVAAELDGRTVAGVVVDPSRGETWAAVAGRGARCNGRPVAAATGRSTLATALVATGFGYEATRRAWQADVLRAVLPAVRDIRRFGAASLDLCWVAGGRLDAYYEWGLHPWDAAAGALIVTEAGGRSGCEDGLWWAATSPLAEPLLQLLRSAAADRPPPGLGGA